MCISVEMNNSQESLESKFVKDFILYSEYLKISGRCLFKDKKISLQRDWKQQEKLAHQERKKLPRETESKRLITLFYLPFI